MPDTTQALHAFNAGEISHLALARVDLAKLRVACEVESNVLPFVLGPAMFRPGTAYIGTRTKDDLAGQFIEFKYDPEIGALLVLTPGIMRVLVDDAYLTRPAVTAAITNGNFDTDLTGWTDSDESGATSDWFVGGFMVLTGTGFNYALRDQQVTVNEAGIEHALRLVVNRGTVSLKVGVSAGDATYWDLSLGPGTYSLAFIPAGNFWIRLGANDAFAAFVDSIAVDAAGIVELPTPWAAGDLDNIFYTRSNDVIFVACEGRQQRRIERRALTKTNLRSWGIALYLASDGPFRVQNLGATTIAPSTVNGNTTLTASHPLFKAGHVGALFRLTHQGQAATATLAGNDQFTGDIRVSGISAQPSQVPFLPPTGVSSRSFAITVSGSFGATVTLQRSLGITGNWTDVESYTSPISKSFDDGLDNQIVFYRLGIKAGAYSSGAAVSTLTYAGSIQNGVVRITGVTNPLSAGGDVLSQFGNTTATSDWSEGEWSDERGWPLAVEFHDGRLCWGDDIKFQASVSDAFDSFDDEIVGDSGPINRTVTSAIRWLLSLQRLIAGTGTEEISIRSSAFDEPIAPTRYVARTFATRGAARVRPLRVDDAGIYVAGDGARIFEMLLNAQSVDYSSDELTKFKQEMCAAGVTSCAVQRHPDTRLWYTLGDGTCAVLTYERKDDVVAWTPVTSPGLFERVGVLPGTVEDGVYFIVARTIGAATHRFIEKLSRRTESVGGTLSRTMDCHLVYTGAPTSTISAPHLEGREVVVWADGVPRVLASAPLTITGGVATLPGAAVTNYVVGLPYTARIKTSKLAYGGPPGGTALEMRKRIDHVGLVMADVCPAGVRIGRSFDNLTGLPATYRGRPLTAGEVLADWDDVPGPFNGGWDSDSRVCIEISSPYPVTFMGLVIAMTANAGDDEPAPSGRRP